MAASTPKLMEESDPHPDLAQPTLMSGWSNLAQQQQQQRQDALSFSLCFHQTTTPVRIDIAVHPHPDLRTEERVTFENQVETIAAGLKNVFGPLGFSTTAVSATQVNVYATPQSSTLSKPKQPSPLSPEPEAMHMAIILLAANARRHWDAALEDQRRRYPRQHASVRVYTYTSMGGHRHLLSAEDQNISRPLHHLHQLVQDIMSSLFLMCLDEPPDQQLAFAPRLVRTDDVRIRIPDPKDAAAVPVSVPLADRLVRCTPGLTFAIHSSVAQSNFEFACEQMLWDMDKAVATAAANAAADVPMEDRHTPASAPMDGPGPAHVSKNKSPAATPVVDDDKDSRRLQIQTFFRAMCTAQSPPRPRVYCPILTQGRKPTGTGGALQRPHAVLSVCEQGLDLRLETGGRYGRGIYFNQYAIDALMYLPQGLAQKRMALLVCDVALGVPCRKPLGDYDPTLFVEPPGYFSLLGYMRFGQGAVQYRPHASLPTHVVFCRSQVSSAILLQEVEQTRLEQDHQQQQ